MYYLWKPNLKRYQMNYLRIYILLATVMLSWQVQAKKPKVTRIDPPGWWVGMENPNLQLMIYGERIAETTPEISYEGVLLKEVIKPENPNYLFINLTIAAETKPGTFDISFKKGKKIVDTYSYTLSKRENTPELHKGFDNSDAIYLLMPDRFANGDSNNDNIDGMKEKADPKDQYGRHGGDLKGIRNHLDYFENLGVTTLWINPVLENDMPQQSYHGYAITDYYKIDPRFGTNEDYRQMVAAAHKKGLKVIMDMVANHCGTGYYWNDDLPSQDWYNQWPEFTRTNYRGIVQSDPYASPADYDKMVKGWFDKTMADLNQHNPYVAEFIIQNTIWWIEYAGLDGIRQDTYPYPYKDFMVRWMQRILEEYPDFNVVGEVWLNYPSLTAYWLDNETNKDGYRSYLTNVFDFPLMYALNRAFNEEDSWDRGTLALYEILAQDFLYSNPMNLVVFTDNHDGDRFYTKMQEDIRKFKLGMAFVMTVRGIPQIYYGGEILMTGYEHDGHGHLRENFPGGWPGDKINAFTQKGLSEEQLDAFNFTRRLLNWRKTSKAVQYGKFIHYIPENGVYVYFRYTEDEAVMVLLNNNEKEVRVDLSRFAENLQGYSGAKSVLTRSYFDKLDDLSVPAKSPIILDLVK